MCGFDYTQNPFSEFKENDEDAEYLHMFSFTCMLGFDVFVRNQIIEYIIGNELTRDD